MKPTKVRNQQKFRAMNQTISKEISAPISKELRKKYSRRNARILIGDAIKVIRGEYKGIAGKVSKISTQSNSIAIEGNKKEKLKWDKIDIYIHSTNVIITALNTDDKWRLKILEKKPKSKIKSMKAEAKKTDTKKTDTKKTDTKKTDTKKTDTKKADTKKADVKKENKDESTSKKEDDIKRSEKK